MSNPQMFVSLMLGDLIGLRNNFTFHVTIDLGILDHWQVTNAGSKKFLVDQLTLCIYLSKVLLLIVNIDSGLGVFDFLEV